MTGDGRRSSLPVFVLFAFYSNHGAILYRLRDIVPSIMSEIFIPHLYLAHPQGVTPSEFREYLILIKLERLGYRAV